MEYTVRNFGHDDGKDFDIIEITNGDVIVSFTNLGARINQWQIVTNTGIDNLILGFDTPQDARRGKGYYYGASIGRVGGRISNGSFSIDEKDYQLPLNEGENNLHGGPDGFDLKRWDYEVIEAEKALRIIFSLRDADGENGFPGNLAVQIIHTYTEDNRWEVTYKAETDQDTLFNPTNHVYFNLNGQPSEIVLNHQLQLEADSYVPVNPDGTPVEDITPVEGTPFDLRDNPSFEDQYQMYNAQVDLKDGFDHPFVLNKSASKPPIVLSVPELNRRIEVTTDRDAVVVYTHNVVDPQMTIWEQPLQQYSGVALETQSLPDAINQDGFGDIILRKGTPFESKTSYKLVYGE